MTIQEEAGKTVRSITDGLKGQPISLALIIMNVVFIGFTYLIFHELNARTIHQYEAKDQLIMKLIGLCDSKTQS
jgi:hypothetical protein